MKPSTYAEDCSPTAPRCAADRESSPGDRAVYFYSLAVFLLLIVPHSAHGQGDPQHTIIFDHRDGPALMSRTLDLRDGQEFLIRITNTCAEEFEYQVLGRQSQRPSRPQMAYSRALESGLPPLSDVELDIRHDAADGGYLVEITRPVRGETQSVTCVDDSRRQVSDLLPKRMVINVRATGWEISVSAGFSLSNLKDEACGEGKPKCSHARPGLVTYFHVHHSSRLPWLAVVFGTGLSDGRPEYYSGLGLRLGDVATLNAGLVVGAVERATAKNLDPRFKGTWFFGASYRLFGSGNAPPPPLAGTGP